MSPELSKHDSPRLEEDLESGEGPHAHVHGVNGNLSRRDSGGVLLSERSSLLHRGSNVATKKIRLEASFCDPWFTSTRDFILENEGLLLIAAAQLFFALMNLGVKLLSGLAQPVPTFELIATRMAVTWVCCVGWMYWRQVPFPITGPPGIRHLLVLRGVTGFFGLFGAYYGLQYLSLSDSTAIIFLSPTFAAVAGFIFLRETLKLREILAGLFSLFGVLLIARPEAIFGKSSQTNSDIEKGTPAQRLGAVGVALFGVLSGTGAVITIRHINTRAHPMHSIAYFSAWCVIVACAGSAILRPSWVLPTDPLWTVGLLGIGIAGFIAQVLLTTGLQRETAGRGSIGVYVQIIYSTVLERIFFTSTPSILSITGTCIIMTSALYVGLTKQKDKSKGLSTCTGSCDADRDEAFLPTPSVVDYVPGSALDPPSPSTAHSKTLPQH